MLRLYFEALANQSQQILAAFQGESLQSIKTLTCYCAKRKRKTFVLVEMHLKSVSLGDKVLTMFQHQFHVNVSEFMFVRGQCINTNKDKTNTIQLRVKNCQTMQGKTWSQPMRSFKRQTQTSPWMIFIISFYYNCSS